VIISAFVKPLPPSGASIGPEPAVNPILKKAVRISILTVVAYAALFYLPGF
jgi:hypothetical protein